MKLKEVISHIESFAPPVYQESYDNSGIQVGFMDQEVHGALLCLDVVEATIDEAIEKGVNLIIAHHPVIFTGLKRISNRNLVERIVYKAIKNDVAIYAVHTNLDAVQNGVSFKMAEKLGLRNVKVLEPKKDLLCKLVTFVPQKDFSLVEEALFNAGAGNIGAYDECGYALEGEGSFRAGEGTNPYVGKLGQRHREKEVRFETVFSQSNKNAVIGALKAAHPYEEVAYDIYELKNEYTQVGFGAIGDVLEVDEKSFLERVKNVFKADGIRYTKCLNKSIKKVALCGGSGSFLLGAAKRAKADIFITADFKYHQFFDADGQILIADIGHFESEQFTSEIIYELLQKKLVNFALHFSGINTNPVNYI